MAYLYYPGCCCALKATGKAYEESLLAIFRKLDVPWEELDDWNCCGATAYMSIDERQAMALAARNLALAERQAGDGCATIVPPCSACFYVMRKAQDYMREYPSIGQNIDRALHASGLAYHGTTHVRHPLDILVNDIGLQRIAAAVTRPLTGIRVASYYGCFLVRPYSATDDVYNPTTMDRLMAALGAEVVDWPLKTRCCGGSLTGTVAEVGLRLTYIILKEAGRRGADVLATACPFCECNLECFQRNAQRTYKDIKDLPAIYFTQLVGWALGISYRELGLQRLLVPLAPVLRAKQGDRNVHA